MKRIKQSTRGCTFTLDNEKLIGTKFRYVLDLAAGEIVIIPDKNGKGTVSRKKCGKTFKPLYDIRSKEVRELVSKADYMEVETVGEKVIIHVYRKVSAVKKVFKSNIIRIEDIFAQKTGEIVIDRAVGGEDYSPEYLFGKPTLANEDYFSYISSQIPSWLLKKDKKEIINVYDTISLFSGAGLLDYAFRDPKIRMVYGVDFDKDACTTYRKNIGDHIECRDIRDVQPEEIPHADLVIGGPCCQGYSNANRINEKSETALEKRLLIEDYVRIVAAKKPKVFVIENVPQLLTKDDGLYMDKVLNGLPEYTVTATIIKDDEVGGYTTRRRAIVIGSRIGEIKLPDTCLATRKTVKDALSKVDATWFNYGDVTMPREDTKRTMSYVPQGGNWMDIPETVHKFGPSTQSNTYRRLAWDEQSPTITNWRKCILIHPEENRILTVSEAAALMGLDKAFKIYGETLNSKQQQVGNGVTQAIGQFVKKHVLEALDRSSKIIQFA